MWYLPQISAVITLVLMIAIPVGIFFVIKRLIKFTTKKNRQEYDPERDR